MRHPHTPQLTSASIAGTSQSTLNFHHKGLSLFVLHPSRAFSLIEFLSRAVLVQDASCKRKEPIVFLLSVSNDTLRNLCAKTRQFILILILILDCFLELVEESRKISVILE